MPQTTRLFICYRCRKIFDSDRSDADAAAELRATFGDPGEQSVGVLCTACYEEFMEWWRRQRH